MNSILLEFFGCGESGTEKDIETTPVVIEPYQRSYDYQSYGMPLVGRGSIDFFESQFNIFNDLTVQTESRPLAAPLTGDKMFTKYSFSFTGSSHDVYTMATCQLHWLKDGKAYPPLLGGAAIQPGESIVVLKSGPSSKHFMWQPGLVEQLSECAYLNMQLDPATIKILISRSVTEKYHQKVYYQITKTDIGKDPDWVQKYFDLFSQNPQVPVVVNGGERIGSTLGTEFPMYFKMGDKWDENGEDVYNYLLYHRRYENLLGHPLITRVLGHASVKSQSVDVIPRLKDDRGNLMNYRWKKSLIDDFWPLATSSDPSYHPLCINMEEHPHRVYVPRPLPGAPFPIQDLPLRNDHFITRLKISNPLELPVTIDGFDTAELIVSPTTFSDVEKVVELRIPESLPETTKEISIMIKSNGDEIQELMVTVFNMKLFLVTFHKLVDYDQQGNAIHQTLMDENKLREILAYANEILGRQSNTYIVPERDSEGNILRELRYEGDLGEVISDAKRDELVTKVYQEVSASDNTKANVIFIWNTTVPNGDADGITVARTETAEDHSGVFVNTNIPGRASTTGRYAQTVVHELGHWLSQVFGLFVSLANGTPSCDSPYIHFKHPRTDCVEVGDWSLYGNLMNPGGGWFISKNQADLYNTKPPIIIP
jgi:hypothetical protein